MTDKKLTGKESIFCKEWINHFNASRAAVDAGYSENTKAEIGYENLRKPHIRKEIKALLADRVANLELTSVRVGKEIAAIAYARLCDVGQWDGEGNLILAPSCLIPDEIQPAIQSIKKIKTAEGERLEIKMHSKEKALEMIAKHTKFFEEPEPPKGDTHHHHNYSALSTKKLIEIKTIMEREDD